MKKHWNQTMRRVILAMLAAALVGCQPSATPPESGSSSEGTESSVSEESKKETASVRMEIRYTDEVSGDLLEIPQIDAAGAEEINGALMEMADKYREYLEPAQEDYDSFCEVMALPFTTDDYISIVMVENVFPTYGTDGELTSFVYDRGKGGALLLEDLLSSGQVDEEEIRSALSSWVSANQTDAENEMTVDFSELRGFRMCADNAVEVFFSGELAYEQAGGDSWKSLFSYYDGTVMPLRDRYGLYAQEMDRFDPPLYCAEMNGESASGEDEPGESDVNSALALIPGGEQLAESPQGLYLLRQYGLEMDWEEVDPIEHLDQATEAVEYDTYFLLLPKYVGSQITVESMEWDGADFSPVKTLYTNSSTSDGYGLIITSNEPEGGINLQVTVAWGGQEATNVFTYDGKGDRPAVRVFPEGESSDDSLTEAAATNLLAEALADKIAAMEENAQEGMGIALVSTGTEEIGGEMCRTVSLGNQTAEKFTAEEHYAVSPAGEIYFCDIINGGDYVKYIPGE